uniref:Uncharacterized protein n=1 Tax=Utricularia reniformis TaxID=192314 RepID=A0A1Y0B4R4_9LAMI|nr:hypothetical protein AEK19_MT2228 [Utricularia reniformis]ART32374.1 hypothetical protein AEK19_MT2228 [Utricularia reniformis]
MVPCLRLIQFLSSNCSPWGCVSISYVEMCLNLPLYTAQRKGDGYSCSILGVSRMSFFFYPPLPSSRFRYLLNETRNDLVTEISRNLDYY